MCGIAGVYRFDDRRVNSFMLERMREAMRHRGPDDEGLLVDGPVGLVHNRLSILDLSPRGHQPMHDPIADSWIVYNGEVYNFQELRSELETLGHAISSTGDTEVILYAHRQWGDACLDRFNGMFAFAIFEPRKRELFLARDRLGIKPLYYYVDDDQFIFASEIKAILRADGVSRRIDREALPELLAFRYVTGRRTVFQNIHALEPGWAMRVTSDGVRRWRYWDVHMTEPEHRNGDTWLEELEYRLKDSVRAQLIADVPVGCALSGGVDSTLITALACEVSKSRIRSFSIGFDFQEQDERPYAGHIAQRLGIENYSQVLTEDEFFLRLPELVWHMDEPINHPNSAGIWLLAKTAREKVSVLLSGEGADEMMGGYTRFRRSLYYRRLQQWAPGMQALARLAMPRLRGRWRRLARQLAMDPDRMTIWANSFIPPDLIRMLFGDAGVEQAEARRREMLLQSPSRDFLNRHLYLELKTYLVSLLIRVDKMCMAVSLENRVPFLDHTLVEFACRMPTSLKVTWRRSKVGLVKLAGDRFCMSFFDRPKQGFNLPPSYFHGRGLEFMTDLIRSRSFRQRELLEPSLVDRLIDVHRQANDLPYDALWILASLELWARTFIDRPAVVTA